MAHDSDAKIPVVARVLPPARLERLSTVAAAFIAAIVAGLFAVGALTGQWTPFIAMIPVLLLTAGAIFGVRPNRFNGGG